MKRTGFKFYWLILLIVGFNLLAIGSAGQELNPIRWTIKNENPAVKAGDSFKVQLTATIDDGWHLYSLDQPEGGPIPTRIIVPENQKFKLAGEIESPLPEIVFDTNFNMDTQFYEHEAVFMVPVEIAKDAAEGKNTLAVNTFFQTCNDKTCLPPKTVKLTTDIEVTGEN